MKFFISLIFIGLLAGSVPATADTQPESPNQSFAGISAYYSDYLRYQPGPLFPAPDAVKNQSSSSLFTYHEEKKPDIDLFNLLMTGLAVGGAVIMASGGGGGSSSAAPSAPPGTPTAPNNPPSGISVAITPTIDCAVETSNPACENPPDTVNTDIKTSAPTLAPIADEDRAPRLATVTLAVNGLRRVTLVTLATRPDVYDVSDNKTVTIVQTNVQETTTVIVATANGMTTTTELAITITQRATIKIDSSDTTVSLTLTRPGFVHGLNTLHLSVTAGLTGTLSPAAQVTVVDCRISNGIVMTVTTTNSGTNALGMTLYNINGTLDARPYVFKTAPEITFKTRYSVYVGRRCDVCTGSERSRSCRRVECGEWVRIDKRLEHGKFTPASVDVTIPKYLYLYYLQKKTIRSTVPGRDPDIGAQYFHHELGDGPVRAQRISYILYQRFQREITAQPLLISHVPITDPKHLSRNIGYHNHQQGWFGAGDFLFNCGSRQCYGTQYRGPHGGSGPMVFYLTQSEDPADFVPGEVHPGSGRDYRYTFPVIEAGQQRRSCVPRAAQGEYFVDSQGVRRTSLPPLTLTLAPQPLLAYTDNASLTTMQVKNFSFGYDGDFNNLQFSYRTTPLTLQGLELATERGFRKIRNSNSNIVFNKINLSYNWDNSPTKDLLAPAKPVSVRLAGEYMNGSIKSDIYAPGLLTGYRLGVEMDYSGISPRDQFTLGVQRRFAAAPAPTREITWQYNLNYDKKAIYIHLARELTRGNNKIAVGYHQEF